MSHLLIVTHEHIGPKMAGPAIRALEIGRAVAAHGFDVTLCTPYPELSAPGVEGLQVVGFSWDDPASLEQRLEKADAVMTIGPVLSRVVHWLRKPIDRPTIVDAYYVPQIEQVWISAYSGTYFPMLIDILLEDTLVFLENGDIFVCATERQRDFWLGALWMAGRLNAQTISMSPEELVIQVPMGIPDAPPQCDGHVVKGVIPGIGPEDKVILWMGGIWEWTDPLTLLAAWERILAQRQDVRLVFGALQHYDHQVVPVMSKARYFYERCKESGWLGHSVFFLDWIPYEQRGAYLLDADVGISLHEQPFESRYAIRARSLDYLWASLPCVLTTGDELADLLGAYGLAHVVPVGDPQAVADALLQWLDAAPPRSDLALQVRPLQENLRWSVVVKPIVEFLKQPRFAPDAYRARERIPALIRLRWENDALRQENDALRQENEAWQAYIESVRKGRLVRLMNWVYRIFGKRYL